MIRHYRVKVFSFLGQMPDTYHLKDGGVYFGSQLQCMGSWPKDIAEKLLMF